MTIRTTLAGLAVIVALCGGGLYLLQATFGRDAQMRDAERDFLVENHEAIQARQDQLRAEYEAGKEPDWSDDDDAFSGDGDEAPSLDDWYAEAGSNGEPLDVSPEDKSYLINDAAPTSDGEPIS